MKLEMHCHSNKSDWVLDEKSILSDARDRWLDFVFLTDHDRVSDSFCEKANDFLVATCPSVEISSYNTDQDKSVHLTFYAKKITWEIYQILENTIKSRIKLIKTQIEVLQKTWFIIDLDDFYKYYLWENRSPDSLNRYDIARYMFLNPYNRNLAKKINDDEEIDFISFYIKYLKKWWIHSKLFYATIPRFEPNLQVLNQIRLSNNAVVSLAHSNFSFWSIDEFNDKLPNFVINWVNAIEINAKATLDWVTAIIKASHEHDLFLTFWSDCHFIWNFDNTHWDFWVQNPFVSQGFQEREFNRYRDLLGL